MTLASTTLTVLAPQAGYSLLSSWDVIEVCGKDRSDFLKGLLTNQLQALPEGGGNRSLYLTPKGRIEGEALVARLPDRILLLTPPEGKESLLRFLHHYHVIEDVTIEPCDAIAPLLLVGRDLSTALSSWDVALPVDGHGVVLRALAPNHNEPLWATRYDALAPLEMLIAWLPTSLATEVTERCQSHGLEALTTETVEQLRAAAGWFTAHKELQGLLIHEAGLQSSHVNFKKGCFVGQEVVARTQHRGKANKELVVFQCEPSAALAPELALHDESDRNVGQVLRHWQLPNGSSGLLALVKSKALEQDEALHLLDAQGTRADLQRVKVEW